MPNYIRENYNADLDFGTGEWSASAWVNVPVSPNYPTIGSELVSNGTFTTDTTGWTGTDATLSIDAGRLKATLSAFRGGASAPVTVTPNTWQKVSFTFVSGWAGALLQVGTSVNSGTYFQQLNASVGTYTFYIYPTVSTIYISLRGDFTTGDFLFDNVSVLQAQNALIVDRAHSSGSSIRVGVTPGNNLTATAFDGTTTRTVTTTAAYNTATWIKPEAVYTTDGTLAIRVNGTEVAATRGTPLLSLNSRYNYFSYTEDNVLGNGVNGWSSNGTLTKGIAGPDATLTALEFTGSLVRPPIDVNYPANTSVTVKFQARKLSGSALFSFVSGNTGITIGTFTATNAWTEFSFTFSSTSPGNLQFTSAVSDTIQFAKLQLTLAADSSKPYQRVGNPANDVAFGAPLTIGNSYATDAPFPGSISLLKLSATVPTSEQSQWMYEQEKQMFRDGAQVCLPDSGSIVDLTYDDATDKWIAVSATNESEWSGLVRTSVTASPAGSYTKVAATSGIQLQARTTTNPGVDITIPTYTIREELVNRAEKAAKLARNLITLDYVGGFTATTVTGSTAITSAAGLTYPVSYVGARISGSGIPTNATIVAVSGTTIYISAAATASASSVQISFIDFNLPVGYESKIVLAVGVTKVEGSTKDFTRLFDGFKETVRFGTAPGYTATVQIQATRG